MNLRNILPSDLETDPIAEPDYQLYNLSVVRSAQGRPGHVIGHFWLTTPVSATQDRYLEQREVPNKKLTYQYTWNDREQVGEPGDPDYVAPQYKATLMRTVQLYSPIVVPPVGHPAQAAMATAVVALAQVINTGLATLSESDRNAILTEAGLTPDAYPLSSVEGLMDSQVGVLMIPSADSSA